MKVAGWFWWRRMGWNAGAAQVANRAFGIGVIAASPLHSRLAALLHGAMRMASRLVQVLEELRCDAAVGKEKPRPDYAAFAAS